ncbi:MAG TPA: GntR family transcriptional regulator [Gammaproteobacteria bacterium]|nr:GntR family transcriptional regulator [Gammaproteobacteria bacterium]
MTNSNPTDPELKEQSTRAPRDAKYNLTERIRQKIIRENLPEGGPLREEALAREFSVSRPRVREALAVLEERGLVERIRNKGAVVATLSDREVSELFAVVEVVEALCVREATRNAPRETWEEARSWFGAEAEAAVKRGRIDVYESVLNRYRALIIDAADNNILRDIMDGLYDRIRVLVRRLLLVPDRAMIGIHEHRAILDAMCRDDPEEAERLARENLRSARRSIELYRRFLS